MTNPIQILSDILTGTPAITAKVGTYSGTAFPLIVAGVIPENETALPAITYTPGPVTALSFPGGTQNRTPFTVNCYATTASAALDLAMTVQASLDYTLGSSPAGDIPASLYADVGPTVQELDGDAWLTTVSVVLVG